MKKMIFTLLGLFLTSSFLFAQDISISTVKVAKIERTGIKAVYNMPSDVVEDALAAKLKESNISKGSKVKGGLRVYKGVSIPEISPDKIDVYTKVSGKKSLATLFFLVSRGYDNFVTPENDTAMVANMKNYVKSMMTNVNVEKLKVDISEQAKITQKADKANDSAIKTGRNLADDMKDLERKIKENKKEQEEAAEKLKEEEKKLNDLKSKLEMLVR